MTLGMIVHDRCIAELTVLVDSKEMDKSESVKNKLQSNPLFKPRIETLEDMKDNVIHKSILKAESIRLDNNAYILNANYPLPGSQVLRGKNIKIATYTKDNKPIVLTAELIGDIIDELSIPLYVQEFYDASLKALVHSLTSYKKPVLKKH